MARTLLAAAIAAPWVLWAIVRVSGLELPYPVAPALAFTPYVAPAAVIPVAAALLLRRGAIAAVALASGVVLALVVLPRGLGGPQDPPAGADRLTVMSVNVLLAGADPGEVMALVREHDVDALALQESRPEWIHRLDALGAAAWFRGRAVRAEDEALLTRAPLAPTGRPAEGEVTLPGGRTVRLTVVHPFPPISRESWRGWHDELLALPPPAPGVTSVLAGDFNATLDHPELREVLGRGYRDAAATVGAGWTPTWPAGRRFPPEITIDHVLVSEDVAVLGFDVRPVAGSDHRAVIAELAVSTASAPAG